MLCGSISAQESENADLKYFTGGSLGFSSESNYGSPYFADIINFPILTSSNGESNNTSVSAAPYFGRQLNEIWSLGIQLQYAFLDRSSLQVFQNQPGSISFESQTHVFGAGLFSRYSFFNQSGLNIFCQPFFDYGYLNTHRFRDGSPDGEFETNMIEAGLDLGATYQFSPSFRALIRVGGFSYSSGNTAALNTGIQKDFNSFNLRFSMSSIGLGVEYWW